MPTLSRDVPSLDVTHTSSTEAALTARSSGRLLWFALPFLFVGGGLIGLAVRQWPEMESAETADRQLDEEFPAIGLGEVCAPLSSADEAVPLPPLEPVQSVDRRSQLSLPATFSTARFEESDPELPSAPQPATYETLAPLDAEPSPIWLDGTIETFHDDYPDAAAPLRPASGATRHRR
jgi:hypothetical protein